MATNIELNNISQVMPPTAPASVRIDFQVKGFLPDVVQIYASGVGGDIGSLIEQVDMSPPEISYNESIELPSGTTFFVHLCPRNKGDDGRLDDQMNGMDWQAACTVVKFTTQAPPGPPPRPKPPTPAIGSIEPHQATLHDAGRIDVHWAGSPQIDLYHFMWSELPHGWNAVEVDSGGSTGVWTVAPATAGRTYSFKVQGCISRTIGLDDCSPFCDPVNFVMPANTNSLREFLRLSDVRLVSGIRSLGTAIYGSGFRVMMHL
jgi:hypothetical protein